ncbi:MAG TPA: hypothetical protein VFA04_00335 [Bryobacteraceae bacterium]|nr:hypothetical protein [Bryobacteraceae bacterium]
MKRWGVIGLITVLLPFCAAGQDTATSATAKKHAKRHGKRHAAATTQSSNAPAPPAPDTPHDPANAAREQLPGNPQAKPAGPDK